MRKETDMNDLNVWTGIGRLVRDPEVKQMPSGGLVLNFPIAVSGSIREGDRWVENPNFFDCTHYPSERAGYLQYLKKGKQVGIRGELRQDRWETQEGKARSRVVIVVREIELLGGNRQDDGSPRQEPERRAAPAPAAAPQGDARQDDFTDDIPF